jgi:hypothetical protein
MQTITDEELLERMRCKVLPQRANGLIIEKFKVDYTETFDLLRSMLHYAGRAPKPGVYTRLVELVPPVKGDKDLHDGRKLWMSDTQAELFDHLEAARRMCDPSCHRVLIHGLGLGCVVNVALSLDNVEHIDVVEKDWRVIRLVAPQLDHPKLVVHEGDAYVYKWAEGEHWDVVWHDIWPDISTRNLVGMHRLYQRFQHRSGWQGFWARDLAVHQWLTEASMFKEIRKQYNGIPAGLTQVYSEHQAEGRFARLTY